MRSLILFLLMTTASFAQSVPTTQNNAVVNIVGNNQNVSISQSGTGHHTAIVNSTGHDVPISITQSGSTDKSVSLTVNCVSSCSSSPYIINQY